jgi:hypothetical protein
LKATSRLRTAFEEASNRAVGEFESIGRATRAKHRGVAASFGRRTVLLDAAISMQQDRIRAADEAFAESPQDSRIIWAGLNNCWTKLRWLPAETSRDGRKLSDIKHQAIRMFSSPRMV